MKILGILPESHETGAALLVDGVPVAAVSEERLSRIKMDGAFPRRASEEVLRIARLVPSDLDAIAFSGARPVLPKLIVELRYALIPFLFAAPRLWRQTHSIRLMLYTYRRYWGGGAIKKGLSVSRDIRIFIREMRKRGFNGKILYIPHDEGHAASAYYASGMRHCLVPVYEGFGFVNASSIWHGRDGAIRKLHDIRWPHSPGSFYRCITKVLGFVPRKHAGKITGLAAYGDPSKADAVVSGFLKATAGTLRVSPDIYSLGFIYDYTHAIPEPLSRYSREDLAAAFQSVLEKALLEVTRFWLRETEESMVALAGGVAGNVKLNQGISKLPGVERVYVQPAMSDAGQPLGAAYAAYARLKAGTIQTPRLEHVYLGGDITAEAAEEALRNRGLKGNQYPDLARRVAHLAATGKIIALCHGRMEYGPRALGNRSIVGSPSDPSINDTLNKRLHRTEFMPFAPVTLAEEARRCYPEDELSRGAFAAEFMTICMDCDPSMKGDQGAVVHVDGTARPQLIRREQNPFYYDVVKAFFDETGIPSMINTSFNMHEEPIVNSADDAVRAWQEGDLDALVLGPFLVER